MKTQALMRLKNPAGFTLIELMVSLLIALLLFSGLSFVLVNAMKSSRIQADSNRLHENARFGIDQLARDIRGAGYAGCSEGGPNFNNNLVSGGGMPDSLIGFEYSTTNSDRHWYPTQSSDPAGPPAGYNSDALFVNFAQPTDITLTENSIGKTTLTLDDINGLNLGDLIYVSNCQSVDLFQINSIDVPNKKVGHSTGGSYVPGNASDYLLGNYYTGDSILHFKQVRYQVAADSSYPDQDGNAVPTLFKGGDPFISGVDNFQILYGEDTNSDGAADTYRQADDVNSWPNVRTLELALLMRGQNQYGNDIDRGPYPKSVLDYDFADDDQRVRRRVFTTTIDVRNAY